MMSAACDAVFFGGLALDDRDAEVFRASRFRLALAQVVDVCVHKATVAFEECLATGSGETACDSTQFEHGVAGPPRTIVRTKLNGNLNSGH